VITASRPDVRAEDFAYVAELLRTQQIARGPFVRQLESRLAEATGVRSAIAVSSGTAALHVALLALEVGRNDEVIVPTFTCAALLHAVNYVGARPVLADVDPATLNPSVEHVRRLIGPRTRAIIITHTFGFPADLRGIIELGVPVVEDCAHALGAQYWGKPVGAFGALAVHSFYATKVVCAGEGGAICTNSRSLAKRVRDLTDPDGRADYRVRYNYKLSDLAAGLALNQLARLGEGVDRRRAIAARYRASFSVTGVSFQTPLERTGPNYYRFVLQARNPARVMRDAAAGGVVCDRPVYRPLHHYEQVRSAETFPGADSAWRRTVAVPCYPALTDAEVDRVVEVVGAALKRV
jgi:perosamine synthetase